MGEGEGDETGGDGLVGFLVWVGGGTGGGSGGGWIGGGLLKPARGIKRI